MEQIVSFFTRFRNWNVRLSDATTPTLLWETRGFALYSLLARAELGLPENKTVADLGGGRTWQFGETYHSKPGFRLIGVDVSGDELALNKHLDKAIVADICQTLGAGDEQLDLILSRATVEHLHDTSGFLRAAYGSLRPDGKMGVLFAAKWSIPAMLNRIIPERIAIKLLEALVPNSKGYQGFKAYYDKCGNGEFQAAARSAGFTVLGNYPNYYASSYFQFFLPLHMLSILHDLLRTVLSIKALTAMNLFVLQKPNEGA